MMMPIPVVSAKEMAHLESIAYQAQYSEQDFMEQAGKGVAKVAQYFLQVRELPSSVGLLCGKGNNGGDAFVAGRGLLQQGCQVVAVHVDPIEDCSPLCQMNLKRFLEAGGSIVKAWDQLPQTCQLILDGLFGTGFKGEAREPYASLIRAANQSHLPIISVDIPSGLNGSTGEAIGAVIQATETAYLELPKLGFFFLEGWNKVGQLHQVHFGLPQTIIQQTQSQFQLLTDEVAAQWLPPIKRNRHKYQAGYVIGLAGSPALPGAALLSSLSALRGGSGMVRLLYPQGMEAELVASPYELIKVPYHPRRPEEALNWLQKGGATFVGPGLGHTEESRQLLAAIMPHLEKPCVIDADALTILAEGGFKLPKQAILTPHTGEMQRLLHTDSKLAFNEDLIDQCQRFVEEYQVTLVLKGAPTWILHPGKPVYINPTGNPGMATAGSGDVLTGLIASLLSQGLGCHEAAALGVYLHGLAGEYAAQEHTSRGMIASDIIDCFSLAYAHLQAVNSRFLG